MGMTMDNTSTYTITGETFTRLSIHDIEPSIQYGNVRVDGNGFTVVGNAYFGGPPPGPRALPAEVAKLGLCFGSAPQLGPDLFVGRDTELEEISRILDPGHSKQLRLVLGGIGGIGKTQLAITYAQRYEQMYDSVFWLNATTQATLNADIRLMAGRMLQASELEGLSDEQVLTRVHEWLSQPNNTRWLLVLDNYDEPTQYDISKYCPYTAHGAVMITTRLPDSVRLSSETMHIQPLADFEESLDLLCRRSERMNIEADEHARRLVKRLSGLPLALATAGAYLNKSPSMTFQQYLDAYEKRWNIDPQRPLQLKEYQDRTLFTTWDMSYAQLETDDPQAAQLLKLLAYFDNQKIWYKLLADGILEGGEPPSLLQQVVRDPVYFEGAMRTLTRYCFVEAQSATQSYSMHNCVHDWTLANLNTTPDKQLYWYAFDSVAAGTIDCKQRRFLGELQYAHLTAHATRLAQKRFLKQLLHDMDLRRTVAMLCISALLAEHAQLPAAEEMCMGLLACQEKKLGLDHVDTLKTMNHLGFIYRRQHAYDKAEDMYARTLAGREKVLGPDQSSTLNTIHSLGIVYVHQGRLDKAEETFKLALGKMQRVLGSNDGVTLRMASNLARVYYCQGRLDESQEMYTRVLAGRKTLKAHGHSGTFGTISNIGDVFYDQGKFKEAEDMYKKALAGRRKALGPHHKLTLNSAFDLGELHRAQGRFDDAKNMYTHLLTELDKKRDWNRTWPVEIKSCLAIMYFDQGKPEEAEQFLRQARTAYENRSPSGDSLSSVRLLYNLAILHDKYDQVEDAETMYRQAFKAYEKEFGMRHPRTQRVMGSFSQFLKQQGREDDAAELERSYNMARTRAPPPPPSSPPSPSPSPSPSPWPSPSPSTPLQQQFQSPLFRSSTPRKGRISSAMQKLRRFGSSSAGSSSP